MTVRYITPPRPLVPGSKVYTRQRWETKIKNKIKNVTKIESWLEKSPAAPGAAWLDGVGLLALGAAGKDDAAGAGRSGEG